MSYFRNISELAEPLPFVPEPNTFVYLTPSGYCDERFVLHLEDFKRGFRAYGYKLIFLPELVRLITPKIISYNYPSSSGTRLSWERINDRFVWSLSLDLDGPKLVLFKDGTAECFPLDCSEEGKSPVQKFLDECPLFPVDNTFFDAKPAGRHQKAPKLSKPKTSLGKKLGRKLINVFDDTIGGLYDELGTEQFEINHDNNVSFRVTEPDTPPEKTEQEVNEEEVNRIEEECDRYIRINIKELSRLGVSPDIIRQLLGQQQELSRVHITRSGRIYLEDYENKEIILDDLSKAVFLL